MAYFMGIDVGTGGVRAVVLDETGDILGIGEKEYALITPKPNWVEQNPEDWWDACCFAAKKAAKSSGKGLDIAGIGLSGQQQGSTLLDKSNKVLGNCMIWLDQRASSVADELNTVLPASEIMDINGNFCMPSHWAAKLLWIKRNMPEVFEKINCVLCPKDYLRFMMTGELATDVTDCVATFMFDIKKRCWSDKMIKAVDLPREILPDRIWESADVAGHLKADIAKEWGMKPGIPVVAGGGDQSVGAVGSGVVRNDVVAVSIGTSGVVYGCCDEPIMFTERSSISNLCHSVRGMYSYLGCTLAAGGSYKWLRDTFFAHQRDDMAARGQDVYEYMNSLAEKIPEGSEGTCFLPYLNGEITPHIDPDARGVFFGLSYRHGLGAICRSVMEGVAFSQRDSLEIVREHLQAKVTEVRALGGGAKSALWRQIQADIYNASVLTVNLKDGPAAGAAILAGVGSGHYKSEVEACDSIVKTVSVTDPIPKNVEIYNEYYETYKGLYFDLKERFKSQAQIVEKTT